MKILHPLPRCMRARQMRRSATTCEEIKLPARTPHQFVARRADRGPYTRPDRLGGGALRRRLREADALRNGQQAVGHGHKIFCTRPTAAPGQRAQQKKARDGGEGRVPQLARATQGGGHASFPHDCPTVASGGPWPLTMAWRLISQRLVPQAFRRALTKGEPALDEASLRARAVAKARKQEQLKDGESLYVFSMYSKK